MKRYNKLVRDGIPEIIKTDGGQPHTRVLASNDEYLRALFAKDREEGLELEENPSLGELADKLEVLHAIAAAIGYTPEQVEEARAQKATERGGFERRIFLEFVE